MNPLSTKADDLAASVISIQSELDGLSGLLDGWQRSGNSYPDLSFFRADRAEFVYPPFPVAEFQRETTQSITTGAWNTVVFNKVIQNPGIINYSTASTGLFQFGRPSGGRVFLVFGKASWLTTAGTFRSIKIESYPSTTETIMAQNDGDEVAQGFSAFYKVPVGSSGFGIRVYEEAAAGLGDMTLSVWEIARAA